MYKYSVCVFVLLCMILSLNECAINSGIVVWHRRQQNYNKAKIGTDSTNRNRILSSYLNVNMNKRPKSALAFGVCVPSLSHLFAFIAFIVQNVIIKPIFGILCIHTTHTHAHTVQLMCVSTSIA